MTNIATLYLNADCTPAIQSWGQWRPTQGLRYVLEDGKEILQQEFTRDGYDSTGAISGSECEWRDVPITYR